MTTFENILSVSYHYNFNINVRPHYLIGDPNTVPEIFYYERKSNNMKYAICENIMEMSH